MIPLGIYALLIVYVLLLLIGGLGVGLCLLRRRKVALVGVGLLTALSISGWHQLTKADLLRSLFYPEDTVYAAGFSEAVFRRLPTGTASAAVLQQIGKPLGLQTHGTHEYWYYSQHGPKYKNYWNRILILDRGTGRVAEKFVEFYTD